MRAAMGRYWGAMTATLALLAGCATFHHQESLQQNPVAPGPGEAVVLDNLFVVMDASGSMYLEEKFWQAQALLQSFVDAMPHDGYETAMMSFGGEWKDEWFYSPLRPFNRGSYAAAAESLRCVMGGTYMAQALQDQAETILEESGYSAILLFSDGKAASPIDALRTCAALKAAYPGQLCIYTVVIGDDDAGTALLQEMAEVTGCGAFWTAGMISTPAGMEEMVRRIFFGPEADIGIGANVSAWGPIFFNTGKAVLKPEYEELLARIAQRLNAEPALRLRLEGHTDASATDRENQRLSEMRSEAVRAALVARGVVPGRIDVVGYGESRPLKPNDTPANRFWNRRVEIVFVD